MRITMPPGRRPIVALEKPKKRPRNCPDTGYSMPATIGELMTFNMQAVNVPQEMAPKFEAVRTMLMTATGDDYATMYNDPVNLETE